ncbi:DUF3016 domain-containing protein [Paucibacter sp. KBW04]|uniref:DUF3016 domain-containing protein n=1 Tax=Paucibacter sp. KBW04 TaxID=2153361 RepID=UPI000F571984|nr:DUF3016 domain-containing protein [Paucibacter sp. KBW04]RQO61958.1 DUF3016 domain-containing protein [Paucibacter sp. KBW04]
MKAIRLAVLPLALLLGAAAAQASVEVRFVNPEKFSDANRSVVDRDRVLQALQAHLRELGDQQLPGKDLLIEVTDVDLAGELEPHGRTMEMYRVLRPVTRPAIDLRFVLSEQGKELRKGQAQLSDLSYMDRFNRYDSNDSLRFEKRMLDEWFAKEFAAEIKPAAKP